MEELLFLELFMLNPNFWSNVEVLNLFGFKKVYLKLVFIAWGLELSIKFCRKVVSLLEFSKFETCMGAIRLLEIVEGLLLLSFIALDYWYLLVFYFGVLWDY